MAIKRPYQMKTISSNLFVIDRKSYQRKKDKDKIAHIVSKWDERIANEPKISARDGKFYQAFCDEWLATTHTTATA